MGLTDVVDGESDFSAVKARVKKLQPNSLCPECGEDKTEKKHYYWRCNNDDCDCITFFNCSL